MQTILVLSGPNLNLLGTREPEIYGRTTLEEIHARLQSEARAAGFDLEARQSNHEGELVDWIGQAPGKFAGLVFNPAAFSHTSLSLRDAVAAVPIPTVEVHLSNVFAREAFRRELVVAAAARGVVSGFGAHSYSLGLQALIQILQQH
jgi:3-dehydroquinate dehydratase-2